MGNSCQAPTEADVHRHMCTIFDQPDCLVSQHHYCCSVDDDCTDAFEYQRLEANVDPLAEASNLPAASAWQLPRAAAAAQRAEIQGVYRDGRPKRGEGSRRKNGDHPNVRLVPMDKPAAVTLSRIDDDYDKENTPVNIVVQARPSTPPEMPPQAEAVPAGELVTIHLYDLSEALAQINSVSIDLIGYGGALHVGVEVFGVEWSFGTGGVSCSAPKRNRHYVYRQSVSMGRTTFTQKEVQRVVLAMQREWPGSEYDLFSKNCGTFSNALCIRLGVGGLPAWVTRLAEAGGKSATVRRIADMMAQNGFIGEASPLSQPSQPSRSPQSHQSHPSPQCGSQSCSELDTPRHDAWELQDELDGWLSRLSGEDWLEEELGHGLHGAPPQPNFGECLNPTARRSEGLTRSTSAQLDAASPLRGSRRPPRCATFRANSYPQMNAPVNARDADGEYEREKAFCVKRLSLGPRPTYGKPSANLAEVMDVRSILAEARNGGA